MTTLGRPPVGVLTDDASVVTSRRGLPWWAAVLLAFVTTGVGVGVDLVRGDTLTPVFLACYAAGCVLAMLVVMRRGIFAAMVQPPLILAVAVPLVVRVLGKGSTGGLRNEIIALALPLVNGFPTMAATTAVTVVLGVVRLVLTRRPRPPQVRTRARTHTRTSVMQADTDVHLLAQPERSAPARSPRTSW